MTGVKGVYHQAVREKKQQKSPRAASRMSTLCNGPDDDANMPSTVVGGGGKGKPGKGSSFSGMAQKRVGQPEKTNSQSQPHTAEASLGMYSRGEVVGVTCLPRVDVQSEEKRRAGGV